MNSSSMLDAVLSVEFFAAKDASGVLTGLIMSAPCRCGLNQADSLRVDGLVMLAMYGPDVLAVDLPLLSVQSRSDLLSWSRSGQRLGVAEFKAGGMLDSYFLNVTFVGVDRE